MTSRHRPQQPQRSAPTTKRRRWHSRGACKPRRTRPRRRAASSPPKAPALGPQIEKVHAAGGVLDERSRRVDAIVSSRTV